MNETDKTKLEYIECNFCGGDNTEHLFRGYDLWHNLDIPKENKEKFNVVRCKGCGLIYLNPRIHPDYIGEYYFKDYISHTEDIPRIRDLTVQQKNTPSKRVRKKIFTDLYGFRYLLNKSGNVVLGNNAFYKLLTWKPILKIISKTVYGKANPLFFSTQGLKILDIGCGTGHFLVKMHELGWDVYGVEPNKKCVNNCRRIYNGLVNLDTKF